MKTGMLCILATGLFGMGCNAVKQSVTHDLVDGFYTMKSQDGDKEKVYSDIDDSSITIYPVLASAGKQPVPPTLQFFIGIPLVPLVCRRP